MRDVVFARGAWFPSVVRQQGELRLEVVGGAGPNHDPRVFSIQFREDLLEPIRGSLPRHLLLRSALLPQCYAAGVRGPIDGRAASELLEPILTGSPEEVDALFERIRWDRRCLVAEGADAGLLGAGRIFAAAQRAMDVVTLTGKLVCSDGEEAATVRRHLPNHLQLTRAEEGCLQFSVEPTTDPLVWRVSEKFRDQTAFDVHQSRVRDSEWGRVTSGIRRDYVIETGHQT